MLIVIFFSARKFIGIGTIFNILLVENLSDVIISFLNTAMDPLDSFLWKIIVSLVTIILLSIGAALYISAVLGVAPYDALPIIVEEKSSGRFSFQMTRIILDVLCILLGGFGFGATLGINTLILAFLLGPLMQFFRGPIQSLLKQLIKT